MYTKANKLVGYGIEPELKDHTNEVRLEIIGIINTKLITEN